MPYSERFKRKMVEKLCGRGRVSATELARQSGVTQPTLSRWLREARVEGMKKPTSRSSTPPPPKTRRRRPQDWSAEERLDLVVRVASMPGEEVGATLRREGLQTADVERWRRRLLAAIDPRADRQAAKRKSEDATRVRALERELRRKDAALAETAALLVLKKKVQEIWGDEDDDTRPRSARR